MTMGLALRVAALATVVLLSASLSQASRGCDVKSVSSGQAGVCALRNDDRVSCWSGDSPYREMFEVPDGLYTQVSVGVYHACGVRQDGSAACWGSPPNGYYLPTASALEGSFKQLSVGNGNTCGVRADGAAVCLGNSQVGPQTLSDGEYLDVQVGYAQVCGRRLDRTVECWGGSEEGEGDPPPGTFRQISAGYLATCGIRDDGRIECWGYGGESGEFTAPEGVFTQLSVFKDNGFSYDGPWASAVRQDGTWIFWGDSGWLPPTPPQGTFREVSSGPIPYGLRTDGEVESWAEGYLEWLPLRGPFTAISSTGELHGPIVCGIDIASKASCSGRSAGLHAMPPGLFKQLAIGYDHGCGLHLDGSVACWNSGYYGVVATGEPADKFQQISSGYRLTCGVQLNGRVSCWRPQPDDSFVVLDVPGGKYLQITVGDTHACALETDGDAVCWEYNDNLENFAPPSGPFAKLASLTTESFPRSATCGIRPNGAVACWGGDESLRQDVPSGAFVQVAVGVKGLGACGVRPNGSIECWGQGPYPEFAPPEGVFTQVAMTPYHTCGLETDGTIRCWGSDNVLSFCGIPPLPCGNGSVDAGETCDDGDTDYAIGESCTDACAAVPCGQPVRPDGSAPAASDALYALHTSVENESCSLQVCDVNASSTITTVDALAILRSAVGLVVELNCPL